MDEFQIDNKLKWVKSWWDMHEKDRKEFKERESRLREIISWLNSVYSSYSPQIEFVERWHNNLFVGIEIYYKEDVYGPFKPVYNFKLSELTAENYINVYIDILRRMVDYWKEHDK